MTNTTGTTGTTSLTGNYNLDPAHSRLGFSARHAMVTKVRGAFNEVTGSGYLDEENPSASHLEVTIKAASIDTRNPDRDAHLRSNDFLAMDEYPEITFRSTAVDKVDQERYSGHGRPHYQRRHQAGDHRLRVHRQRRRSLGEPPARLRGQHHHQPQGLGRQLERRPGSRRRPGQREDHPRVRGCGGESGGVSRHWSSRAGL